MPVGDIRDGVNVRNVAVWIAQRFQIDRLGIALNGPFQFRQIVRIHKRRRYAIVGQCVRQQIVTAAINRFLRDNVIARLRQRFDGVCNGSSA